MEAGPRRGVLRTPESRFERVAGFPWTPHYLEVEPGLRLAHLDTAPRDAAETLVLLHGEELASKIIDFVRRTSRQRSQFLENEAEA